MPGRPYGVLGPRAVVALVMGRDKDPPRSGPEWVCERSARARTSQTFRECGETAPGAECSLLCWRPSHARPPREGRVELEARANGCAARLGQCACSGLGARPVGGGVLSRAELRRLPRSDARARPRAVWGERCSERREKRGDLSHAARRRGRLRPRLTLRRLSPAFFLRARRRRFHVSVRGLCSSFLGMRDVGGPPRSLVAEH